MDSSSNNEEISTSTALEDIDGTIHSIRVRNFFCHENFEITFNKNINFIVGRNGSGKSAILTALVIGLGARASVTCRGKNIQSFIRKGANSATIEIKIKNSSSKAYKHNIYGDFITIVRTITAGGSTYIVKSASGEKKSTKLEEVHAIVTAHDIQVDNPISVLNQDDAKSFHKVDAKMKYDLFRKATNLDQTEQNYLRAIENCKKAHVVWNRNSKTCKELEKKYKECEEQYEMIQQRDKDMELKLRLQDEYYWSEIADKERDAATLNQLYDKLNVRIEKLMQKLSDIENLGSNSSTISALEDSINEKSRERKVLEQQMHQAEKEVRELQAQWKSSQQKISKHNELVRREKKKQQDLEKELQNINSGETEARRAQLEREAEQAARAAHETTVRADTAQREAEQAQAGRQNAAATLDRASARLKQQHNTIRNLKMQYRDLEDRGGDSLAVYGRHMAELVAKVNDAANRKLFTKKPLGPIGSYLKVRDKKWASAIEHILGGSIQSFCVNSPEDSRVFFKIMNEVWSRPGSNTPKPGVTCSAFLPQQHNVEPHKVRAGPHLSALDSLDIAHPVVANYLIDNFGVEKILLVPDDETAMQLSDSVERVPRNCNKIVTLDSTEFHPAPNYRSYGGAGRASRFLTASSADRKRQLESEMARAASELSALEQAVAQAELEVRAAETAEREAARALNALRTRRHKCDSEEQLARLALQDHHAPHLQVLVDELKIVKDKLSSLDAEKLTYSECDREFQSRMQHYDATMANVKSRIAETSQNITQLCEEIEQEKQKVDKNDSEKQTCLQQVKEHKEKQQVLKQRMDELRTLIEQKTAEAELLGPRISEPRRLEFVSKLLREMEAKLRPIAGQPSKEDVAAKYEILLKKYSRTKGLLDELKNLIEQMKESTKRHLEYCYSVQTLIAIRAQVCFQNILAIRHYSAKMEINHADGRLELFCTGRDTLSKLVANSMSSMSGGERSYSTVAFIMSLWECVELPFFFMDEFDVFMDNVNRKMVMDLLIGHAKTKKNRLYVFLTPHDASSVTASPEIELHKMDDPRP